MRIYTNKLPIIAVVLAVIGIGGFFAVRELLPALRPPFFKPPEDITKLIPGDSEVPPAVNETGMPLKLPPGFQISIFAKDLPGARVMRFDQFGNMWVSRTEVGAVTLLEIDRDTGRVRNQDDILSDCVSPMAWLLTPRAPSLSI